VGPLRGECGPLILLVRNQERGFCHCSRGKGGVRCLLLPGGEGKKKMLLFDSSYGEEGGKMVGPFILMLAVGEKRKRM